MTDDKPQEQRPELLQVRLARERDQEARMRLQAGHRPRDPDHPQRRPWHARN